MGAYGNDLSERKKIILKAIIDSHIGNGEPVGSKFLAGYRKLSCSPATIRNEMAELEAMGYLEQPHTSAGRIPSELGYRFYVDALRQRYNVTTSEIEQMYSSLRSKLAELDQILVTASRVASTMTNYTGIAVRPKQNKAAFERYEVVYLNPRNFLLVMINPNDSVKTKYVRLGFDITPRETETLARVLNDCIAGVGAEEITLPVIVNMERRMGPWSALVSPIVKSIYETMSSLDGGELRVEGANKLLQYPEYADVERLRGLLSVLESKDELLNIISRSDKDDVNVYIGSESELDTLNTSSLVFRTIRRSGRIIGAVGVIGPRRMEYSKVIAMIDSLAKGVNDVITEEHLLPDTDNGE